MIDEVVERAVPWGFFIGLGALIGAAFPGETRAAAKKAMLTGFRAADWLQGVGAEAYEKGQDVFAEARLEYGQLAREAQREADRRRLTVVPGTGTRRPSRRTPARRATRAARSSREFGATETH